MIKIAIILSLSLVCYQQRTKKFFGLNELALLCRKKGKKSEKVWMSAAQNNPIIYIGVSLGSFVFAQIVHVWHR